MYIVLGTFPGKIFLYTSPVHSMLVYAEKYLSTAVFHLLYKVGTTYCGSADGLCSVLLVSYLSLHQYHIALIIYYIVVVVQLLSHVQLFVTLWIAAHQAFLSITIWACSNSRPLSWWCLPTISPSIAPFSCQPQFFPASAFFFFFFPMS